MSYSEFDPVVHPEPDRFSLKNIIGDEGVRMLDALLAAGNKDIGRAKAWSFKASIIKFTINTNQLIRDGKLSMEKLAAFQTPFNSIGNMLVELLKPQKFKDFPKAKDLSMKPALLSALLKETWGQFQEHVYMYFDQKDLEKTNEAMKYFSGTDFISQFLNDKELKNEKKIMAKHAQRLKQFLTPPCKKKKCQMPKLMPYGIFPGSAYCLRHHNDRLTSFYDPPSFEAFIENKTTDFPSFFVYFEKTLLQDTNIPQVYSRFKDYRKLEKEAQRKQVSKNVYDKYLVETGEKYFKWPETLYSTHKEEIEKELNVIRDLLEKGLSGLRPLLFSKLEKILDTYLRDCFDEFTKSPIYQEKLMSYQLPDELKKELQDDKPDSDDEGPIDPTRPRVRFDIESTEVVNISDKPVIPGLEKVNLEEKLKKFTDMVKQEEKRVEQEHAMKQELKKNREVYRTRTSSFNNGSNGQSSTGLSPSHSFSVTATQPRSSMTTHDGRQEIRRSYSATNSPTSDGSPFEAPFIANAPIGYGTFNFKDIPLPFASSSSTSTSDSTLSSLTSPTSPPFSPSSPYSPPSTMISPPSLEPPPLEKFDSSTLSSEPPPLEQGESSAPPPLERLPSPSPSPKVSPETSPTKPLPTLPPLEQVRSSTPSKLHISVSLSPPASNLPVIPSFFTSSSLSSTPTVSSSLSSFSPPPPSTLSSSSSSSSKSKSPSKGDATSQGKKGHTRGRSGSFSASPSVIPRGFVTLRKSSWAALASDPLTSVDSSGKLTLNLSSSSSSSASSSASTPTTSGPSNIIPRGFVTLRKNSFSHAASSSSSTSSTSSPSPVVTPKGGLRNMFSNPPALERRSSSGPPPTLERRESSGAPPLLEKRNSSATGPPPLEKRNSSAGPPPLEQRSSFSGPPPLEKSGDPPALEQSRAPPPLEQQKAGPPPLEQPKADPPPLEQLKGTSEEPKEEEEDEDEDSFMSVFGTKTTKPPGSNVPPA